MCLLSEGAKNTMRLHLCIVIQTALVPIGFPGPVRSRALHLDMYTATGLFSALLGIANIVLLVVVFKEHTVRDDQFNPVHVQQDSSGKC